MSFKGVLSETHIGSDYTVEEAREFVLRRLEKRIRVLDNGCWEWTGSRNTKGYGMINVCGERWTVTRLMLALHVRRLLPSELACHTCDWPPCCNKSHLFIGDKAANAIDKVDKGTNAYKQRTHCPKGHAYAEHGYFHPGSRNGREWRGCKLCQRIAQRLRAGWTREQAEALPRTPHGHRPVAGVFKRSALT